MLNEISKLEIKKKYRNVTLNCDFWYKKNVKCSIKIKKTKPTPKSITHKNPIKISVSDKKERPPINIK